MSRSLAMRPTLKPARPTLGGALVALSLLLASGCQAWSPVGNPLALGALGQDSHTKKLAAQENFPSPADVGLSSP